MIKKLILFLIVIGILTIGGQPMTDGKQDSDAIRQRWIEYWKQHQEKEACRHQKYNFGCLHMGMKV